jgi:hypothetical protein
MVKAVSEQLSPQEIEILSRAMGNLKVFFRTENMNNSKSIANDVL